MSAKYGKNFVGRIFEFPFFRFLGTISFSVYLLHIPILESLNRVSSIDNKLKIYIFFAVTILVASFSFLLVERPLSKIRLKRKTNTNNS